MALLTHRSPRVLLRGLLAVALLGALFFLVDRKGVLDALADISLQDLGVLFALSFVMIFVSVLKWRGFLLRLGIKASLGHLFRLYLVGYFVNLVMPSSLGGDFVRSLYVDKGGDKVRAVSATLLERYTGLVAMVLMGLCGVWWAPQVTLEIKLLIFALGLGVGAATWLFLSGRVVWLSKILRVPSSLQAKLMRVYEALAWGTSDRKLLGRAAILSIVFHLLTVVNTMAVAHAVGWQSAQWSDLLVIVPLILLVGAIPLSPQGLGIQEGAFVYFLHAIGATTGQALAVALVLRAKSYVLAACGGVMWLGIMRKSSVSCKTTQ